MAFDGATVLLQWAAGGLLFLWVTTRRREVGLGYGWLLRGVYAADGRRRRVRRHPGRSTRCRSATSPRSGVVLAALAALAVSIVRKDAGVAGQKELVEARSAPGSRR